MGIGVPTSARAGGWPQTLTQFSNLLNDYTPTSTPTSDGTSGKPISGSPYEMHGTWTLDLNRQRSKATFSAAVSMERFEMAAARDLRDAVPLEKPRRDLAVVSSAAGVNLTPQVLQRTALRHFKLSTKSDDFGSVLRRYRTHAGINAGFVVSTGASNKLERIE